MKIKYKQKGFTSTNNMVFENFCEVDVSEAIGKELLKQPHLFEEIKTEDKKIETKTEPKEAPKKTTRTKAKPKTETKSESK